MGQTTTATRSPGESSTKQKSDAEEEDRGVKRIRGVGSVCEEAEGKGGAKRRRE